MKFCNYCREHFYDGRYDVEYLSNREFSITNEVYTGIEAYIDLENKELVVFACLDNKNIKPVHGEVRIPINYCPICGKNLEKGEEIE